MWREEALQSGGERRSLQEEQETEEFNISVFSFSFLRSDYIKVDIDSTSPCCAKVKLKYQPEGGALSFLTSLSDLSHCSSFLQLMLETTNLI